MCVILILDKDKPNLEEFQNHNSRQQNFILNKANKVVSENSKELHQSLENLQKEYRPQYHRSSESEQEKIPLKAINKMTYRVNIFLGRVLTILLHEFKTLKVVIKARTGMPLETCRDQSTKTRKKRSKTNEVAMTKSDNAIDIKNGDFIEDDVINFPQITYLSRQKASLVLLGTKSNRIMSKTREDRIIVDIKNGNTSGTESPNYAMKITNMAIQ